MKSKLFRTYMVVGILVLLGALITPEVYTASPNGSSWAVGNKPVEASIRPQAQDFATEPAGVPSEDSNIVYTYDAAGRLIKVEYSTGTTITYTYDAAGNMLTKEISKKYPTLLLNIPLTKGWNLISVPLNLTSWELGDESIVGDPLNITPKNSITSIYKYNTTSGLFEKCDHFDNWGWWPATGSESFTALESGSGYWVMTQQDCSLTFTGTAPSDLDVPLDAGWNLIGWYSMNEGALGNESEVGNPLNVTPSNSLTSIYRYNTTSALFEKSDHFDDWGWWPATGSENFAKLEPGRGYWVMAQNDAMLKHKVG